MFRKLRTDTEGTLYLHSMPGRYEPLEDACEWLKKNGITTIFCLASNEEIERKSPDYAVAIKENRVPAKRICFPVPDYDIPEDVEDFYKHARDIAARLKSGENLLIHCAGGVGRTGMLAGCVLAALGLSQDALEESGSFPDANQKEIIRKFSSS